MKGPNKKEFTGVYWTPESVFPDPKMISQVSKYFLHRSHGPTEAIFPDGISYDDLTIFVGYKTKVTIEIIP